MEPIDQQLVNTYVNKIAVKLSNHSREELKRSPLTFVLCTDSYPFACAIRLGLHQLGYSSVEVTDINNLRVYG